MLRTRTRTVSIASWCTCAVIALCAPLRAANVYTASFESGEGFSTIFDPDGAGQFYAPGSIHTQPNPGNPNNSWFENTNAGVHGEVVVTPLVPPIPPGLGSQSLHMYDRSDTVLIPSPGFGASSPNQSLIVDAAGETGSFTQGANAQTPGAHARTTDRIQAEFWFRAGPTDITANQIFLNLNLGTRDTGGLGPSRRYADGFLAQSATNAGKYALKIQHVAGTDPNNFVLTPASVGELNRNQWYRMVLKAVLVDGLAGDGSFNDIVTFSAYDTAGSLVASITGGSLEVSYKYSSAGVLRPASDAWYKGIAINAFGYRLGASVTPDEIGYLDGLTLLSGFPPAQVSLTTATCNNGATVVVSIRLTDSPAVVVGGQFFLSYNDTVLQFASADPGDAPFLRQVYECSPLSPSGPLCTPTPGMIDYGVGINDGDTGTSADTVMARITFNVLQNVCTSTPNLVTFRASGPNGALNLLSDPNGDPVAADYNNLGAIRIDNMPPSINCPADLLTLQCPASVPAPATNLTQFQAQGGTVSDNCGGPITVTHQGDSTTGTGCQPTPLVIMRTYRATDNCGNFNECTQEIRVVDEIDPVITCPPNVVVDTDPGVCSADLATLLSDFDANPGTYTLLGDANGTATLSNAQSYSPTTSVRLFLPSGSADFAKVQLPVSGLKVGNLSGMFKAYISPGSAQNLGAYMYMLVDTNGNNVFDFNGGNTGDSFIIAFVTGSSPFHQGRWYTDGINGSTTVHVVGNRTGLLATEFSSSNGGGLLSALRTHNYDGSSTWGDKIPLFVRVGAGEWPGAGQFETFIDDIYVARGLEIPASVTDNCGAIVTAVRSDSQPLDAPYPEGNTTITWTATDACGNTDTCNQLVTVEDNEPPAIYCPDNVTVDCGESTDPAGISVTGTQTFDSNPTLSPTQAPGAWYTDRFPPFGFVSANFGGGNRLKHSIDASDCEPCRPGGFNSAFYNTQGRKYDVPGTTHMTIELYVPAAWAGTGRRMAGFWGTGFDSGAAVSSFPIIEFTSSPDGSGVARFRGWNNVTGTWIDMGLPTGFAYNNWYTLDIELVGSTWVYTVGDLQLITSSIDSVEIGNVILQGHNNVAGVSYDIYWDNFVTAQDAVATDNCGTPIITYNDDRSGLTGCNATGTIVRTWTATDDSGNIDTCTQNITVVDTTDPVMTACPSNITVTPAAGSCTAVVNYACPTAYDQCYDEGFEDPDFQSGSATNQPSINWNNSESVLSRVASGTGGIPSKSGGFHGVIDSTGLTTPQTGAFTRLRGYSSVFGAGFKTSVDVYLDLADPAVVGATPTTGYGWDLSSAANAQNGNHLRDFIFHTAAYNSSGIVVAGSNNSNGVRRNDLLSINHYTVTATGWYTFESVFRDNGSGVLAVDLNLRDAGGSLLFTETRSDPSDLISTIVGGNRYMWFIFLQTNKLAIDNTQLIRNVPVICSPASGSTFPTGPTTVTATATDACGNVSSCNFTVTVNSYNEMVVDVELGGGVMATGPYTRAITFELWNGAAMTYSTCQTFTFTSGNMPPATLQVPCGVYTCVTGRDRLHTLRRTINPLPTVGTQYSAVFTGAKRLIGGNLNDDKFIDILDFGIYTLHDLTPAPGPGGASTDCTQVPPFRHPDINGDGVVNSIDFTYVGNNFLQIRENNCDGSSTTMLAGDDSPGGNYGDSPITSISVNDLINRGMGELAIMDLNHDGQFNQADMTLWMQGVRPGKKPLKVREAPAQQGAQVPATIETR